EVPGTVRLERGRAPDQGAEAPVAGEVVVDAVADGDIPAAKRVLERGIDRGHRRDLRRVGHVQRPPGEPLVQEPDSPRVRPRRRRPDELLDLPGGDRLEQFTENAEVDALALERELQMAAERVLGRAARLEELPFGGRARPIPRADRGEPRRERDAQVVAVDQRGVSDGDPRLREGTPAEVSDGGTANVGHTRTSRWGPERVETFTARAILFTIIPRRASMFTGADSYCCAAQGREEARDARARRAARANCGAGPLGRRTAMPCPVPANRGTAPYAAAYSARSSSRTASRYSSLEPKLRMSSTGVPSSERGRTRRTSTLSIVSIPSSAYLSRSASWTARALSP